MSAMDPESVNRDEALNMIQQMEDLRRKILAVHPDLLEGAFQGPGDQSATPRPQLPGAVDDVSSNPVMVTPRQRPGKLQPLPGGGRDSGGDESKMTLTQLDKDAIKKLIREELVPHFPMIDASAQSSAPGRYAPSGRLQGGDQEQS
eukprot:CAMPEP_0184301502 /NCGR_PEP_ID=MMETSP1049-20130417/11689_1 /TAXON_ID=77928 /ORGANISM="Proteomonas sulcata, Strain CCMP704" /LENGTH=145 /DNA_ID=CAMNT_0026612521 /DNA_START=33 /DNA_END=466 /DNA_ORIENTATION=-